MKTNVKVIFASLATLAAAVTIGCASATKKYASPQEWVTQSKAGNQLPLAEKADVWSEAKTVQGSTGQVVVKSKFEKQHGTTCIFEVEYSNPGTTEIKEMGGLLAPHQNSVYGHNSASFTLKPGAKAVYGLEARECPLKWGESKEMDTCASCMIRAAFVNK